MFQSPKIGSVVSNWKTSIEVSSLYGESFNPLKSGQLFQMKFNLSATSQPGDLFQSPKIGSVVSNKGVKSGFVATTLDVSIT